jgi:hypothetical protein
MVLCDKFDSAHHQTQNTRSPGQARCTKACAVLEGEELTCAMSCRTAGTECTYSWVALLESTSNSSHELASLRGPPSLQIKV